MPCKATWTPPEDDIIKEDEVYRSMKISEEKLNDFLQIIFTHYKKIKEENIELKYENKILNKQYMELLKQI